MIEMESMRKTALAINTVLLGFVTLMLGLYAHYDVTYMVYHSIPTICIYLALYFVLYKKLLDLYVWVVYAVIAIYMMAATICLGYNYGFHLYCMSLIPLVFYMEYFSIKLHTRRTHALPMSIALACVYLLCTWYAVVNGPAYQLDARVAGLIMTINAVSVFCFLIGYTYMQHRLVIYSEEKLSEIAHTDQLTGLFNRHYMLEHLETLNQETGPKRWIAIVDIDDFKGINDTYGHNCGDYILSELSRIMREVCRDCIISRWGGEEFLISPQGNAVDTEVLEKLRGAVEAAGFTYQGDALSITITIGAADYQAGQSLDSWIQSADSKLYAGKNNGKNQVVS